MKRKNEKFIVKWSFSHNKKYPGKNRKVLLNQKHSDIIILLTNRFKGQADSVVFLKLSLAGQIPNYSKLITVNPACPWTQALGINNGKKIPSIH